MIVDAHCHFVSTREPRHAPISFASYLARARAAGIDRSVVFAGFSDDYREANRRVAALISRHHERLLGFGCVHAESHADRVGKLVEEAVALGFCGLKVHRRDAALTDAICEAAAEHRLPILYDPHDEVDVVARFAARHPDVNFVVPHLGSFRDQFRAQLRCIDHVAALPNLFADSSAIKVFDLLVGLVMKAGARKLLFGTDGPWLHPGLELAKIRALGLTSEDEDAVLGANLLRLLPRGPRSGSRSASRVPSGARGR
jgi:predicted TIM-barrel fold metal-dependent hydrolase